MINIKKMIIPTVAIAILSVAIATSNNNRYSTKDLDGKYTLNKIIAQDGEVTDFAYGGELTVKDLKTTFNTSSQSYNWEIEKDSYEIIEDGFIETSSETNEKYVWKKVHN